MQNLITKEENRSTSRRFSTTWHKEKFFLEKDLQKHHNEQIALTQRITDHCDILIFLTNISKTVLDISKT